MELLHDFMGRCQIIAPDKSAFCIFFFTASSELLAERCQHCQLMILRIFWVQAYLHIFHSGFRNSRCFVVTHLLILSTVAAVRSGIQNVATVLFSVRAHRWIRPFLCWWLCLHIATSATTRLGTQNVPGVLFSVRVHRPSIGLFLCWWLCLFVAASETYHLCIIPSDNLLNKLKHTTTMFARFLSIFAYYRWRTNGDDRRLNLHHPLFEIWPKEKRLSEKIIQERKDPKGIYWAGVIEKCFTLSNMAT